MLIMLDISEVAYAETRLAGISADPYIAINSDGSTDVGDVKLR